MTFYLIRQINYRGEKTFILKLINYKMFKYNLLNTYATISTRIICILKIGTVHNLHHD